MVFEVDQHEQTFAGGCRGWFWLAFLCDLDHGLAPNDMKIYCSSCSLIDVCLVTFNRRLLHGRGPVLSLLLLCRIPICHIQAGLNEELKWKE